MGSRRVLDDFTHREGPDEALRETEARLRSVLEGSRDALYRFDLQTLRYDYVSPSLEKLLGYTAAELHARDLETAMATIHPDDVSALRAAYAESERTGTAEAVYRQRTRSGDYRWVSDRMSVRTDDGGGARFRVGSVRDVTEARCAEEALRETNARLEAGWEERTAQLNSERRDIQSVIDNTPAIVYASDLEERFVMANSALAKLLDSTPERMIGRRRHEFMPEEDAAWHEKNDGQVIEAGEALTFEEHSHLGDRSITWLTTKFPLRDAQGRICAVAGISSDISERKRAEAEREELIAALREADRRKNEFIAVLSHELRNPLAPIANSLYVLDHARPGGEQADRAKQVIQRQVAQLTNLVDDLLDVTRITRNKVQLQRERLELNELVRRAVEDNRSFLEQAGVRLELALAPRPVPVLADRTRVSQVVGNLLQNAAKFSAPGGSTRVSVAAEGHAAVIRVRDDGVGIDEATLRDLFQPFMQADKTLDRSKGGLGLGLALVKGLVELHGGSVSARSDGPGTGSEFVVRLPLDAGAALEPGAATGHPAQPRRRILVIEDNVDAAESLREVLELGGHQVAVAHDGQSGIDDARAFRPEVVLCDIGLPGMDGYAVARAFRGDEVLKRAFLIALSGYALPEDLQRAGEAGFARHVSKPPSVETLDEALSAAPAPAREAS